MNWIKVNLDTYKRIQTINRRTGEVSVGISPKPYKPGEEEEQDLDTELLIVKALREPSTYELRKLVQNAILEYDGSPAVNVFKIKGEEAWLNRNTRVSLVNSLNVQKDLGLVETTMWLNEHPVTFNIDYALRLLQDLELYAIACYNVTQQHLRYVETLNREELFDFNITIDYPDPLEFDLENEQED